jgi:hypothetical protein
MNYLELVNKFREKCAASGSPLSSTVSQTGESLRFCNWINDAWMDIQGAAEDWQFMRANFTFPTVLHQQSYTPAQANTTNFANWKNDSFRIYRTALGTNNEMWLPFNEYEYFRNLYQFGAMRNTYQQPVVVSIDPAKNLLLGAAPDGIGYTVTGEYFSVPVELSASTDIPSLPVEYHRAIIYRAMMFYGAYEAAGEVFQQGQSEFNKVFARLELNQLPKINLGGPML